PVTGEVAIGCATGLRLMVCSPRRSVKPFPHVSPTSLVFGLPFLLRPRYRRRDPLSFERLVARQGRKERKLGLAERESLDRRTAPDGQWRLRLRAHHPGVGRINRGNVQ